MSRKLILWFAVCLGSAGVTVLALKTLDAPLGIRKHLGIQGPSAQSHP